MSDARPKNLSFLDIIAQKDEEIRRLKDELEQRDAIYRELAEAVTEDARRVTGALQDLGDDLGDAFRFQRAILPTLPTLSGFRIDAAYLPASIVSGDIYDVALMRLAERRTLRIFVADATGHGVAAALATMFLKSEYESVKRIAESPQDALTVMNEKLSATYANMQLRFTAVCADIDVASRMVTYASAAHPSPIVIRGDSFAELETGGTFMGVTREADFFVGTFELLPGDRVVFASDGAIDPMDAHGNELGSEGLVSLLRTLHDGISITRALETVVKAHTNGRIPDDITVVSVTAAGPRDPRKRSVRPPT